jgi:hypothetical protein
MAADYSFDVKNIDIWAPAFFRHSNSFIATVPRVATTLAPFLPLHLFFIVHFEEQLQIRGCLLCTTESSQEVGISRDYFWS